MVYQQFINYPNLTVFENIASPLRVAGMAKAEIDQPGRAHGGDAEADAACSSAGRASSPAASSSGPRSPAPWSRTPTWSCSTSRWPTSTTSCARNCATSCRSCSPAASCTVVYATTEPTEALLLGGHTALLHEGRVTQFGATSDLYRHPDTLLAAQVFSDPPINTAAVTKVGDEIVLVRRRALAGRWPPRRPRRRPLHDRHPAPSRPAPRPGRAGGGDRGRGAGHRAERLGKHRPLRVAGGTWVSSSHGVHPFQVGERGAAVCRCRPRPGVRPRRHGLIAA